MDKLTIAKQSFEKTGSGKSLSIKNWEEMRSMDTAKFEVALKKAEQMDTNVTEEMDISEQELSTTALIKKVFASGQTPVHLTDQEVKSMIEENGSGIAEKEAEEENANFDTENKAKVIESNDGAEAGDDGQRKGEKASQIELNKEKFFDNKDEAEAGEIEAEKVVKDGESILDTTNEEEGEEDENARKENETSVSFNYDDSSLESPNAKKNKKRRKKKHNNSSVEKNTPLRTSTPKSNKRGSLRHNQNGKRGRGNKKIKQD